MTQRRPMSRGEKLKAASNPYADVRIALTAARVRLLEEMIAAAGEATDDPGALELKDDESSPIMH